MKQKETKWQEELNLLQSVIVKTGLLSERKWGSEVFTHNGRNVLSYGGFKNYFALWFFNGVFLNDKYNVLVNAQDGKTKALRQWRFKSAAEINEKRILEYIAEAIKNEEEGRFWKPVKDKLKELPELISDYLAADPDFKSAFEKLTPYKQKEYAEYIATAKREETRISRMNKIKPMIQMGIGLNDKYK